MRKPNRSEIRSDRAGCGGQFKGGAGWLNQLRSQSNRRSRYLGLAAIMVTAACGASAQISIPASGIINTIAGAGGISGDGGPATSARINNPGPVELDASGNMYIADTFNNCVRKVTISTGVITTIAGSPAGGYSGDGGAATSARLEQPNGVAVDAAGNVYISDSGNNRIRKVTLATGVIATIAGNGTAGYAGDGGAATSAEFNYPSGVALDSSGNVYIADAYNQRVRKLTVATGKISTIAGNGTSGYSGDTGPAISAELSYPWGVAVDKSGNVFIADSSNSSIRKVTASSGVITTVAGNDTFGHSGDNGPAVNAALDLPEAVSVDANGNLYIADTNNESIRKVTASSGVITTVAGNGAISYGGDGGPATSAAFSDPSGVAVDAAGNIYIADTFNNRIRKVTVSTGLINTVAGSTSFGGDGKAATSALLFFPGGIRVDAAGNLYIADYNSAIRKVAASTGIITTVAGNGTFGYSGDGGPATSAVLNSPDDVALDSIGNLYIADTYNDRIRKVTVATGVMTTVAGSGAEGYSGDGGPATSAALDGPTGVALDTAGNIYFADDDNDVIRKVSVSTGIITTVAGNGGDGYSGDGGPATSATLYAPWYLTVDAAGNIFIADSGNNVIREVVAATGIIKTVVGTGGKGYSGDGGAATSAMLNFPQQVAVDYGGNLYIADNENNRIRKVQLSTTGIITTVAGDGIAGYTGDGMAALSAELFEPIGFAVDASANLYIADTSTDRIRAVGKGTPTHTPVLSWATPATIAYGTALSATQLDATASVPGTFLYSPAAGTIEAPGTYTLTVTFTPTDRIDYLTASKTVSLTVSKAAPVVTWPTPAAITYGTALSATQLDATASVAGSFVYSPAAGTIPAPGADTLSVTFTPTNATDYATASKTVTLTVSKAVPVVTWPTPAAITYGTALSATQLDATASVAGTFVYSPAAGTLPAAGADTLSVTFTPTNATDYATASKTVTLTVSKAAPVVTWPTPAAITYGTALSATQLDATASVAGTFVYSPAAGTIPAAGADTLSVTFTPTNATDYATASKTVTLTVSKAAPVVTWPTPAAITYGTALSATQLDATASVAGTFAYSPAAGTVPVAGADTLSVTFTPTNATDYTTASKTVLLAVNKATPILTWATPAPILTGTVLSSTQLNATASVPGTFVYSPAAGSTPAAGIDKLTATFTPTDTTDYNAPAPATVSLTVLAETITLSSTSGVTGSVLIITGSNFGSTQGSSTVTFGGVTAIVSSWSSTSISVTVPASLAPGTYEVSVNIGGVVIGEAAFVVPPPTINGLSFNKGPVGMRIVVMGVAFGNAQGNSTVTIGNVLAQSQWSIVNNIPQIAVQVPVLALGQVNVVVTVNGVSSAPYPFTVVDPFGCNVQP